MEAAGREKLGGVLEKARRENLGDELPVHRESAGSEKPGEVVRGRAYEGQKPFLVKKHHYRVAD